MVYFGYSRQQATDYKVKEFCKLISEFALEYKTVRDRLLQQQEKRANHRERHKTRGKMIIESGRFGKIDNSEFLSLDTGSNNNSLTGYYNTLNPKDLVNGNHNKEEHNMMEALLKTPGNDARKPNSQFGSTSNLSSTSGGLPGLRGRSRQSISGASGTNGLGSSEKNLLNVGSLGKTFTTDTEEDETVDFLLKSTMAIPKGQPPKKRTKKYGERKSCKKKLNKLLR